MQSQELFGGSEKMNKASGSTSFSQPCWFPWIIMSQPHPEPGKGKEGGASGAPFTKSVSFRHPFPPFTQCTVLELIACLSLALRPCPHGT